MPHSPRAPTPSDLRRARPPTPLLRLSSSLQDLSSYSKLDLEEGPPSPPPNLSSSSFSKDKAPLPSLRRRRCATAAISALCLLSLLFLVYVCALYVSQYRARGAPSYYVVMDCGSTGTRVYIYESRLNSNYRTTSKPPAELPFNLHPLPNDMDNIPGTRPTGSAYRRMETVPGLDRLVHNETGLRAAISPLLRWAEKQIPPGAHRRTFVYLYATGGVRRLPQADSEWILNKALDVLKKSSFVCRRSWVKTISGMEEAYFGWIAINYNMGMLGSMPAKETLGALDLGGSSLQVTFENEEVTNDEHSLSLHIGSVYHHLIAYSLSGYGLNDAFDKSVAHLLKQLPKNATNSKLKLKHPCLNSGYKERYVCSQCVGFVPEGTLLEITGKGRKGVAIELVGAPQWEDCSALAKSTVNLSEWIGANDGIDCDIKPCALADNLPRPHGHFHAMSGFFVVFNFFNLSSDATLDDMLQKGQQFCGKKWEVAKNSVKPQPYIEQYCFRAPYVASLLRDGLHIGDSEVVIGSGTITWTLGVALLEAAQAFSRQMTLANHMMIPGSLNPMILVFMLFMSLMLLGAVLLVSKRLRNVFRRSYLPLFRRSNGTGGFQYRGSISSGDTRVKPSLSPTIARTEQSAFITGNAKGSSGGNNIQLVEPSAHPSTVGVSHSYSYNNLSQIYADNGIGSSWAPHRNKAQLWSRRSQSREDLLYTLTEAHAMKD